MRDSFFLLNFSGDITNVPLNTSITMANIVQRACFSIPDLSKDMKNFRKNSKSVSIPRVASVLIVTSYLPSAFISESFPSP
jgi:hypothetical protein